MAMRQKGGLKAETFKVGKAVTPAGMAYWAYLDKPAPNSEREKNKITVFFDKNDPEFKAFLGKLVAAEQEAAKAVGAKPMPVPSCLKFATEKEVAKVKGIEIGTPFIEFSSEITEKRKQIPVVGPDAKATDKEVWSGDIVRVQTAMAGWTNLGKRGLKCYLNGVQLLKKNSTGSTGTDMFTAQEGYVEEVQEGEFQPEGDGLTAEAGPNLEELMK